MQHRGSQAWVLEGGAPIVLASLGCDAWVQHGRQESLAGAGACATAVGSGDGPQGPQLPQRRDTRGLRSAIKSHAPLELQSGIRNKV